MGNSFDKIDDGFYICGLSALEDTDRLKKAGISHILNAASMELYRDPPFGELSKLFTVKALECLDSPDCNLSVHFKDVADFIEEGRRQGGVVVHCAAGRSRSSASAMAYLMAKERLCLNAAFRKVHRARHVVCPNNGFWRQLRDFEAVLVARGVELQPLAPQDAEDLANLEDGRLVVMDLAMFSTDASQAEDGRSERSSSGSGSSSHWPQVLKSLDRSIQSTQPFATHFLTASVTPQNGIAVADLMEQLKASGAPGIMWEQFNPEENQLHLHAKVVPSMDASAFRALLKGTPGVQSVTSEGAVISC